jgi:hypothetical protein
MLIDFKCLLFRSKETVRFRRFMNFKFLYFLRENAVKINIYLLNKDRR